MDANTNDVVHEAIGHWIEDGVLVLRKADESTQAYVLTSIIGWYSEVAS